MVYNGKSYKGFTLVEIMIVVAIIALLAAVAIPNFVRSRREARKTACVSNMRVIDGSIQQYLLKNDMTEDDYGNVTLTELEADEYLVKGAAEKITCPAAKKQKYEITADGVKCPASGADYHGTYKNGIHTPPAE